MVQHSLRLALRQRAPTLSCLSSLSSSAPSNALFRCSSMSSKSKSNNPLLQIHPEVSQALENDEPVAALESTIVAHGMPYPQNMEVALEVEDILRSKVSQITLSQS